MRDLRLAPRGPQVCIVNRVPCEIDDVACQSARPECSRRSGWPPLWRPTVTTADGDSRCTAYTFVQPCDWQTAACSSKTADCLLGEKVYFVPYKEISETFPYAAHPSHAHPLCCRPFLRVLRPARCS